MLKSISTTRTSALLGALALVLALHPLSGSVQGSGEALAALVKALVCGCEICAEFEGSEVVEAQSCCDAPADSDELPQSSCACGHPSDLPLPGSTPLCEANGSGLADGSAAWLAHAMELSAATLDPLQRATDGTAWHPPPERHGTERGHPPAVAHGRSDRVGTRLAVLGVALI